VSNIDDGGAAFPYREQDGNGQYRDHFGMTLRDYFAAAAPLEEAEAYCGTTIASICDFLGISEDQYKAKVHYGKAMTRARYMWADAMLAARKEGV